MALLVDFADHKNDPGEPFVYATDPESGEQVTFFIRRIPLDVYRRLSKQYGREETVVKDGIKERVQTRSEDEWYEFLMAQAVVALADVKNVIIRVSDEEGAKEWSKALGRPVEQGDLRLDGQLTDGARKRLLKILPKLGTWIMVKCAEVARKYAASEEELAGN